MHDCVLRVKYSKADIIDYWTSTYKFMKSECVEGIAFMYANTS
jgi:hypothetical protein